MSRAALAIKRRLKPIGVIRYDDQTAEVNTRFTGGKRARPRADAVTANAVVIDVNGDDVLQLPEGDREEAQLTMYTLWPIRHSSQLDVQYSDVIVARGDKWKVLKVFNRKVYGCYYKAILGLYRERPQDGGTV